MTRVFRFQNPAAAPSPPAQILLRKRKPRGVAEAILTSADAFSLTDEHGSKPIETYRDRCVPRITLTRREADLIAIANPGAQPPAALEDIHPWLPRKPFINDSAANYSTLCAIVRQYGHHLITATSFCDTKWNSICNAIRMKNELDARFYSAWHLPIQNVHILEERRDDRSVVAIDFNAMYSDCMQHQFPKPSALRLVSYNRELQPNEKLPLGLYRCILMGPITSFIKRHNPFCVFFSGRHLRAGFPEPIEVDLNEFELDFYRRHFARIHLTDAVISDQGIQHPLAKEVRRSFARRRSFRAQSNKPLADREKFFSALMSSCASRPSRAKTTFKDGQNALEHLRDTYGVSCHFDEPEAAADEWLAGRKGLTLARTTNGIFVDGPNLRDGSSCFLLGQRIVARSRVILLETMEWILSLSPEMQICYANIDSIHFSLPTRFLSGVLDQLRNEASDEMGSFKIEAVTRHGLWLEPGRYWLYADNVEKFRNRGVGDHAHPFKDHATYVASRRIGDLHFPVRATLHMARTMSDTRTVFREPGNEVTYQRLVEIDSTTSFATVLDLLDENRRRAIPDRLSAFEDLRQRLGTVPASLPRGEL